MSLKKSPNTTAGSRLFRTAPDRPMTLLQQCPVYAPTPLLGHADLARHFGLESLFIKDESHRMRLGSFKALGGAFAVAQMISDAAGTTDLDSDAARKLVSRMTFITASAGNHGLSVAAGARIFGAKAAIYLAAAVPEGFANRIRALDAQVVRISGSYEDSVSAAIKAADENDWLLLADGSWDGYTERPALVMEGYTVLAEECRMEFTKKDIWPTHVLVQAGVGGLAAAVSGHIRDYWPKQPEILIIEPEAAPCLMMSVKNGRLTRVEGPESNMGRLDCKDASLIAFQSLRTDADGFLQVSDAAANSAVSLLANYDIRTTPSGAAPIAALEPLSLPPGSRCLIFVTEGLEAG
ncbi:diaminopropionate ammonia-lyase [Sneathiella chungangensis]|uniref:Diaminopropionate ammonia-lyase n=2 Tax=Sneathiella chungangensis TaxID=1418234 RepID=A0A845MJR3_9PROT|nr:diaminopropionate ammonia-lyase [Sneathiella chungangensis]